MSDVAPATASGGPTEWCVNCGTAIPATAQACPKCGVRRIPIGPEGPPPVPPTMPGAAPGFSGGGPPPPGYAPPGVGGQPGAYAQPGYGYPGGAYPPRGFPQRNNSKATTALILGILGLVLCQILSIFAIIVGKEAEREIRYSGGTQGGEGLATAGRVLGWIGVVMFVIVVLAVFVLFGLGTQASTN